MYPCCGRSDFRPAASRALLLACAILSLASCQPHPHALATPDVTPSSGLADTPYRAAADEGLAVYRLEPGESRVVCVVRRDGPLARFGHDHAIGSRQVEGLLIWEPELPGASRGELVLRIADLEVDPPDLRTEYRLDTQPDQAAVAATRNNLLQHVLLAEQWPEIRMEVSLEGPGDSTYRLSLDLTLNGVTRRLETDASISGSAERLTAHGSLVVRQSDFGIEPFSTLAGGLRVADAVTVHFHLRAQRWTQRSP